MTYRAGRYYMPDYGRNPWTLRTTRRSAQLAADRTRVVQVIHYHPHGTRCGAGDHQEVHPSWSES